VWYILTDQKDEEQKVEVEIVDSVASEKKEADEVKDTWDQDEAVKDTWDAESSGEDDDEGETELCSFYSQLELYYSGG
jgi:hypothetical protein